MASINNRQIGEGLELATASHYNGLEVPIYNSIEALPVHSDIYPVNSTTENYKAPLSFSTSDTSLESESQKAGPLPSRLSTLYQRRRRLWLFVGGIVFVGICVTIGVLIARIPREKGSSDRNDRVASSSQKNETPETQITNFLSSFSIHTQGITTTVLLSVTATASATNITASPSVTSLPSASVSPLDDVVSSTSSSLPEPKATDYIVGANVHKLPQRLQ